MADDESRVWSKEEVQAACLKGDLSRQWYWHETFRDTSKNMYRTTYSDMIHGREVSVKSDFPSGYGGHVPVVAHDVLFQNTGTYQTLVKQGLNPNRDCFPSFKQQKNGTATYKMAASQEETPSYGSLPDVRVQPPWAITPPIRPVPSHKTVPNMNVRNTPAPSR